MFGDHLPALSYSNVFEDSDFVGLDYYSTPFVIWANYDIDYENKVNIIMSPSKLSFSVMKLANIAKTWYFNEFEKLYEEYPVFNNQLVITKDFQPMLPDAVENNELIKKVQVLQYDLLMKRKYISLLN